MKKLIYIAAMLAAVVAAASCKKGNDITEALKLEAPALASSAVKLELPVNTLSIKTIEFTEAGKYLLTIRKDEQVSVKAGTAKYEFKSGTYTVSGSTYTLNGWGTVVVNNNKVTATPNQGAAIEVTATPVNPLPENDFYVTLARTWKLKEVDITANVNGNGISVLLENIPDVIDALNNKGANISESYKEYSIKDVIFTRSKTFAVEFTKRDPYVGEFQISDNGTFSYTFLNPGNPVLNGSATGKVEYVAENEELKVSVTVKSEEEGKYSGTLILYLSEVK